jgi:hypothetical protein
MRTKESPPVERVPAPGCVAAIPPSALRRIPFRTCCRNFDPPVTPCRIRRRTFGLLAIVALARRTPSLRYELQPRIVPENSGAAAANPNQPYAKRPPGNRVAFSLRENSSNGDKTVKTFWRNLKSGGRGCQGTFTEITLLLSMACTLFIRTLQVTRFETNARSEAVNRH